MSLEEPSSDADDGALEFGSLELEEPSSGGDRALRTEEERAPTQKGLILWIDDDEQFLRSMARSITTHETLLCGSVEEANEIFEDLEFLPDLVLCDVVLPDGTGTDLHQAVPAELAERFVFVTGGVIAKDVADYLKTCGRPTLIKPISVDEVHQLLQRVSREPTPRDDDDTGADHPDPADDDTDADDPEVDPDRGDARARSDGIETESSLYEGLDVESPGIELELDDQLEDLEW